MSSFNLPIWVAIDGKTKMFHANIKQVDNFYLAQCIECEEASSINEDLHQCLVKLVESIKLSASL